MSDLFTEIFPIPPEAVPPLVAYTLNVTPNAPQAIVNRMGGRMAARLRRTFAGDWLWLDAHLITDNISINPIEVVITGDALKAEAPDAFALLDGIDPQTQRDLPPGTIAAFIARTKIKPLAETMQAALDKFNTTIRNARVERESKVQAWSVNGQPALSLSIASRLIYNLNLQDYIGSIAEITAVKERAIGLWVTDGQSRGEIVGVIGQLRDHRPRLMVEAPHIPPEVVERSPDDEWVVTVQAGRNTLEYLARGVRLIVRLPQLHRFEVDPRQALQTLQMPPKARALQVRAVSDIPKQAGIIGKAFDSRIMPESFTSADFEMNLRFKDNRVRPYNAATLTDDFLKCGVYTMRPAFARAPVRVCVVNTLNMKIEDFVEAMRRQLGRSFPFEIEVIRERRVRVVSRENLESAVRVVEKEDPDIILAFFPDEIDAGDDEENSDDATAAYVKTLTLARGLPTHVIYESTLNDPDAMTGMILSILGKTGNTPFLLAEPIEAADYVVGLDIIRQTFVTLETTRLTAIARVYKADGEFLHYAVRELEITEDKLPFVLVRDLFPQKIFSGKRVMIHYLDEFPADLLAALTTWGQAIRAQFLPVEVIRFGAPRLYAINSGNIVQPAWGNAFKLSNTEAFLVSSVPPDDITPQPLHIRTLSAGSPALPIDEALRSVLIWTLLTYGAQRPPKLPVTVVNAEQLSEWLGRGNRFNLDDGVVPFWL